MTWVGKKKQKWLAFRRRFLKNHPPNHEGYYTCYICGKWVLPNEVTLDHIKSRSRHPELVFDEANIGICCPQCNKDKGSMDLERFKEERDARDN